MEVHEGTDIGSGKRCCKVRGSYAATTRRNARLLARLLGGAPRLVRLA